MSYVTLTKDMVKDAAYAAGHAYHPDIPRVSLTVGGSTTTGYSRTVIDAAGNFHTFYAYRVDKGHWALAQKVYRVAAKSTEILPIPEAVTTSPAAAHTILLVIAFLVVSGIALVDIAAALPQIAEAVSSAPCMRMDGE